MTEEHEKRRRLYLNRLPPFLDDQALRRACAKHAVRVQFTARDFVWGALVIGGGEGLAFVVGYLLCQTPPLSCPVLWILQFAAAAVMTFALTRNSNRRYLRAFRNEMVRRDHRCWLCGHRRDESAVECPECGHPNL